MQFCRFISINLLVLLSGVLSARNTDMGHVIRVTNNSNKPYPVEMYIPEFTKALINIEFKKIKDPQDMLYKAILDDSADEVIQAIQAGADVNFEKDGRSPIFYAVLLRKSNVIEALIQHGALVGDNLLLAGINLGNTETNALLIRASNIHDQNFFELYQNVCSNKSFQTALLLLNKVDKLEESTINKCMYRTLSISLLADVCAELVQKLIDLGFDVNGSFKYPIQIFAHDKVFSLFIKNGLDPNKRLLGDTTPLFLAIPWGKKEIVKMLIDLGANVNLKAHNKTPLSLAAEKDQPEIVELLVKNGANL